MWMTDSALLLLAYPANTITNCVSDAESTEKPVVRVTAVVVNSVVVATTAFGAGMRVVRSGPGHLVRDFSVTDAILGGGKGAARRRHLGIGAGWHGVTLREDDVC